MAKNDLDIFDPKVVRRANKLPLEVTFECAETGEILEDFGVLKLDNMVMRLSLARECIIQKQSLETVLRRIIVKYANEVIKNHESDNVSEA